MFFDKPANLIISEKKTIETPIAILDSELSSMEKGKKENLLSDGTSVILSSSLTTNISLITMTILLFIFYPKQILDLMNIMSILLFYN